jgi:hypothetical protein
MMEFNIKKGSEMRLKRIQLLRNCSADDAIAYALAVGWYTAEKAADKKQDLMKKKAETDGTD